MLFRSNRKSTRLNSSHTLISYAVFCLKKKKQSTDRNRSEHVDCTRVYHTQSHYHSFFLFIRCPPSSTLFPYPTLFRSNDTFFSKIRPPPISTSLPSVVAVS